MKKKYYIRDWWDKSEEGRYYYFKGYYSDGAWTTDTIQAKKYDTEQEAIWGVEGILKEETNTELEIITVYY